MNYADAEFLQQAELFGAYPNHVRGNYPIIQKADAIQIIYGRSTFRFDAVINLALGFRDVRHDGGAGAIGKCANCFQMIFRNCVGRVRRYRRDDQGIAFPVANELFDIRHRFCIRLVVGNRKIDHRLAQDAAHSGFGRFISDRVFEVIHIAVGSRAAANHFR